MPGLSPAFLPPAALPRLSRPSAPAQTLSHRRPRASASPTPPPPSPVLAGPFSGTYGPWYLTAADATGVRAYRGGLTACAGAVAAGVAASAAHVSSPALNDALYVVGASGFGLALATIHIYMVPLHNMLKVLFGAGVSAAVIGWAAGGFDGGGIVGGMLERREVLFFAGLQFVAMTGLFFKEAVCFGRKEAVALMFLVPALSGGHFLGLWAPDVEGGGAAVFAVAFAYFCFAKWRQEVMDDLGDKSVFDHIASGGQLGQ